MFLSAGAAQTDLRGVRESGRLVSYRLEMSEFIRNATLEPAGSVSTNTLGIEPARAIRLDRERCVAVGDVDADRGRAEANMP